MTGKINKPSTRSMLKRCGALAGGVLAMLLTLPALAGNGKPMRFDRISMSDGLSQSTVNVVYQDRVGFLWLGTENGLNRYDGYQFHHYKRQPGSPNALANDFIWDIVEDADGDLWIATNGGGLARWNSATDDFSLLRHDPNDPTTIASDVIRAVLGTANDWIWAGTRTKGLDRIDPKTGQITHYRHDPENPMSIGGDEIFALLRDTRGTVWVGTNMGLSRFDPITETFTTFRHDPDDESSISDNRVRALFEDRNGGLWAGTRGGGVNLFDRRSNSFRRFQHDPEDEYSLSENRVGAILEDDAGRLWIGTGEGLNLFDVTQQRFHRYANDRADPGSLSDSYVMSLFQDRSGVLWVGTRSKGLNKWNPRSWGFGHFSPDQLSDGNVTSFAEDKNRNLWVGTFGGGLNKIDRATSQVTHFSHDPKNPQSLSDDLVMSMLLDRDNNLWLGTMSGGLNRMDLDSNEMQRFSHAKDDPTTISEKGIMSLFQDRDESIWVGTFGGGINRIAKGSTEVERFPFNTGDDTGLSSGRATAFAQDSYGRLWIGTDGGGLNVFDPRTRRFHHFRADLADPTSISTDRVYALHVDLRGAIWVGTQGGGLNRVVGSYDDLDSVEFLSLTQGDNSVGNDVVYGIESDTQGHLWLSTNYGITHFVPTKSTVRNFHRSHGLQDEEFNFGAHYRSSRGELYFGGANGFNAFFPSDLKINELSPKVILTQVSLLNEPIDVTTPHWKMNDLGLEYTDDVISFEFAALDFTAPAENSYSYMLEGFDPNWINANHLHHVTYTNLDGGNYTFRVRAANSDGVWQEQGASITFNVEPAPWKTWWAYLAYVCVALAVVGFVARAQQKRLRRDAEYRRRLEQDVQSRTKELAERNEELHNLNQRFLTASLTDPLTGLRNRRYVFQEVAKDIEVVRRRYRDAGPGNNQHPRQSDVVFMMIDLDNFKPVNDTCGHAAGDTLLLEVRDLLIDACRQSDVVIRWGGDEFLVIGRYADHEQAEALAERIRNNMEQKVFSIGSGQAARTTCSIGIASYPFVRSNPEFLEWEQLLSLADAAMYQAKERRNAWVSYVATESSGDVVNPFYAFRDRPQEMVEQGMLAINQSRQDPQEECA